MADEDEAPPRPRRNSYDALWERVENQGSAIRALGEETAIQFRDLRADVTKANSELAASFKSANSDLAASITGLATKFDASSAEASRNARPQYGALFLGMLTAIGVAVTVVQWQSALHDKPVDDKLSSNAQAIADLTKNTTQAITDVTKAMVTQAEYRLTTDFTNRISDLKTTNATARAERMQAQIDKLDTDQVPRTEHQFHWTADEKAVAELRAGLLSLQNQIIAIAPPADALKRLTDREHELEMRVYAKPPG